MPDEPVESTGTRKRKSQAALKAMKAAKQKKEQAKQNDDARIFNSMASGKKSGSLLPGQLENCEYCKKRFTVTSYSKTGSKGGLLCPPCSKREELRDRQSKKSLANKNKRGRRQNVSKILDGIVQSGAPSLVETCIKVSLHSIYPSRDSCPRAGVLIDVLLHRKLLITSPMLMNLVISLLILS